MKLTTQQVEARLEAARSAGSVAALVCVSTPIVYFVLLYLFRSQVAELTRAIARYTFGYRVTALFLIALIAAPLTLLPKLYSLLSDLVAASANLNCPECGTPISSGRDWRICIVTQKCPHCRKHIIAET